LCANKEASRTGILVIKEESSKQYRRINNKNPADPGKRGSRVVGISKQEIQQA